MKIPTYCKSCDREHTLDEISYDIYLVSASEYEDSDARMHREEARIMIEWSCSEGYLYLEQALDL